MTITKARLIIWNDKNYDRPTMLKAAAFILGSLSATAEDIGQASLVI